jgi:uncharacterized OB-fold protein
MKNIFKANFHVVDEVLCNKCGQVNKKTSMYCINCEAKDINE